MSNETWVALGPGRLTFAFIAFCLHSMAAAQTSTIPPVAKQIPYSVKSAHGDRIDEYYWMRDDSPTAKRAEIIEHLNAENAYTDPVLAPLKPLQDKLVAEMRSRVKEDDSTVPSYDNGYWYWRRFDAGTEYPVIVRQSGTPERQDASACRGGARSAALATGKAYFSIGEFAVSPNREWLAWTEDTVGRRMYELRIKNLATGQMLSDRITGVLEPWCGQPTIALCFTSSRTRSYCKSARYSATRLEPIQRSTRWCMKRKTRHFSHGSVAARRASFC